MHNPPLARQLTALGWCCCARRRVRAVCLVATSGLALTLWPVFVSPAVAAEVLWTGDSFCSRATIWSPVGWCPESGPWDVTACVPAPPDERIWSLQNVLDSTRSTVGRFEVRQGDQGAVTGGDRCEIVQQTPAVTGMAPAPGHAAMAGGEVRFFDFQTRYDASTQEPTTWQYQTVGQWHNSTAPAGCPTSSPVKISITGPASAKRVDVVVQECRKGVTYAARTLYSTRLITDAWQSWSFEIKWSAARKVGYVRILHQGREIVPAGCPSDGRCVMATRYSGADGTAVRNHFKLGNYRATTVVIPTVVSYRSVSIGLPD